MAAGDSREAVGAALRSQTQARLRDRFLFRPPRAVSRRRPVEGPALSRGRKRRSSPCRDRSRRRKAARGGVLARLSYPIRHSLHYLISFYPKMSLNHLFKARFRVP